MAYDPTTGIERKEGMQPAERTVPEQKEGREASKTPVVHIPYAVAYQTRNPKER
jgi:hypothetical protein